MIRFGSADFLMAAILDFLKYSYQSLLKNYRTEICNFCQLSPNLLIGLIFGPYWPSWSFPKGYMSALWRGIELKFQTSANYLWIYYWDLFKPLIEYDRFGTLCYWRGAKDPHKGPKGPSPPQELEGGERIPQTSCSYKV